MAKTKKTSKKETKKKETLTIPYPPTPKKTSQVIEVDVKIVEVIVKVRSCTMKFKDLSLNAEQSRRMSIWVHEQEKLVFTLNDEVRTATKIKKLTFEEKKETPVFDQLNFSSLQMQKISDIIKSECVVSLKLEPDTQGMYEELHGTGDQTEPGDDDKQPELDFED